MVEVVEHWLASSIAPEHFDTVTIPQRGDPAWHRVPAEDLVARLGPQLLADDSGL